MPLLAPLRSEITADESGFKSEVRLVFKRTIREWDRRGDNQPCSIPNYDDGSHIEPLNRILPSVTVGVVALDRLALGLTTLPVTSYV